MSQLIGASTRLARRPVRPLLLCFALVLCVALAGCTSGAAPGGAASGRVAVAEQPQLGCPTVQSGELTISGGCDELVPIDRDRVFETDEEALGTAAMVTRMVLLKILAAYTDESALDDLELGATDAFIEQIRATIAMHRDEPRPDDVLPNRLSIGPIGLVLREPLRIDAVGMPAGARVQVKVCWTKHFELEGDEGASEQHLESLVTLVTDEDGSYDQLRVESMSDWSGPTICGR